MVGRLIKKKKIRGLKEDFCQGNAHQPSTAQFIGEAIEIPFFKSQSLEDTLCLGLQAISSEEGISFLKFSVFVCYPFLFFWILNGRKFLFQNFHLILEGGDVS